ncbi:MAG: DoxX family protein [Actinomycetota bacterium]|jgi:hypothetical protein
MSSAYVVITIVAIAATGFIAVADLVRAEFVLANCARVRVPESWLTTLGLLKGAGSVGLLLGLLGVPLVGPAAAIGLTLFFVGAIATHLRARNYALHFPGAYLVLASSSFLLNLAS